MPFFDHDRLRFHYRVEGQGLPLVFQHGLGGDLNQPFSVYRPSPGIRLLGFDFRGHGQTQPLGDEDKLRIAVLAGDLITFLDSLGIDCAIVGGISLGSAVAVNLALRYPDRVLGLVLSRPAWIGGPLARNVQLYAMIARLIRDLGATSGLKEFRKSPEFEVIDRESPDCARSLIGQFEQPRAEECVARLERLAADSPCLRDRSDYERIEAPTLILGNQQDPIHPWVLAEKLSQLVPDAELREITPKSVSLEQHAADVQQALDDFLNRRFHVKGTPC
jgi:pimeloyl-ACP methyl ester carboxylesterase